MHLSFSMVVRVSLLVTSGLTLGAWASEQFPPARHPVPPAQAVSPVDLPDTLTFEGRGREDALAALDLATTRLPFQAILPSSVPTRFSLIQSRATTFEDGNGFIDLVYVPDDGGGQIQFFESNYAPTKPVLAPVSHEETIQVNGSSWDYLLIAFPQPDGSQLLIHTLSRWSGELYISIALHSNGDLPAERSLLADLASSLR
jgi:hypothetical protein